MVLGDFILIYQSCAQNRKMSEKIDVEGV